MTPRQLGAEVQTAHEGRDHEAHARMLARLVAMADPAPVNLTILTRQQLEARRNDLHVQLAAVNDQLLRHDRLRAGMVRDQYLTEEQREQARSLDSSP